MYDIKQLENEWKKYKIKKRKPLYIGILLVLFVLVAFFIFNENKIDFSAIKKPLNYFKTSVQNVESRDKNILLNKGLLNLETKLLSTPTIDVEVVDNLVDIPILDIKGEDNHIESDRGNRKKMHIDIIGTSSITAYEDVEKRFLQSRDIDDALFLAKGYYKRSNYEKAVYWSFEVNKLDEDLEESIFIFVKSKVKLGQKNEGILLLKNYLKKSHSEVGKVLLYKIENDILE